MKKSVKYLMLSAAILGVGAFFFFKFHLSRFKRQLIFQANAEADKWQPYNELDTETANIIKQYWKEGVGLDFTTEQILDSSFQSTWAWSAAFISWVVKASGGDTFPVHQTHAHYIMVTTNNRFNNAGDFKAYSTDEAKPELADIVCKRRGSSDATYGDVHAGDTLHCDVVTSIDNNTLTTIGGNIDNKVKRTTLSLSEDGYLNEDGYFVIIKNK
tara:strand:- start:4249 stop:4890 length:642 start_codon:yes stop_codon:yes gene_type:complete